MITTRQELRLTEVVDLEMERDPIAAERARWAAKLAPRPSAPRKAFVAPPAPKRGIFARLLGL